VGLFGKKESNEPKAPPRILVVDDYQTMTRIMKSLLKQIGLEDVTAAGDGTDALELLKSQPFDLVISDWNMEKMTGLDLLKAIRADAKLKHIKFIMVTAEARMENAAEAKKHGADNYIVKPFDAPTLKAKLDAVLSR